MTNNLNNYTIAVASGKGGTGKTTVSVNLAWYLAGEGYETTYADCDVEEPNGHIFLNPDITLKTKVTIDIPKVNQDKCTGCNICGEICQFRAIMYMGAATLVFPTLCHSCGGCYLACPVNAITEVPEDTGTLYQGISGKLKFSSGKLNITKATSTNVINEVKNSVREHIGITIIDSPPGTTCPVIESVSGCDYLILVTEPTPFGLNDLILAVEMTKKLKLKYGVVINRARENFRDMELYIEKERIPVLARIVDDRAAAVAISKGKILIDELPEYRKYFKNIYQGVIEGIQKS